MNKAVKIGIVLAVVVAAGAIIHCKGRTPCGSCTLPTPTPSAGNTATTPPAGKAAEPGLAIPRLLEFGRGTCAACKAMKPVLAELAKEYEGRLEVVNIDTAEDAAAAEKYGIRIIPTQIFFDAVGEEVFRHEGFYPKEDIVKKLDELGIGLDVMPQDANTPTPAATGQACASCEAGTGNPIVLQRPEGTPLAKDRLVVFLFHSERECPCGQAISAGAAMAISGNFADRIKAGTLECTALDIQDEENAHYADTYKLAPVDHLHNGLVLVEMKDNKPGRWKKLDRADELKDTEGYPAYVKKEIEMFIKGAAAAGSK